MQAPAPKYQGDEVDYQITVTNNGPHDATGVTLTDNIPGDIFVENPPQTSQGSCTETFSTITCDLGTIANGKSAFVFLTTSVFRAGKTDNAATAKADQKDPNPANNTGHVTIDVQQAPTPLSLENALHTFGVGLKAAGLVYEEGRCLDGDKAECAIIGTALLAERPGLTGERAASYLRDEISTLCVAGLAHDDLTDCIPVYVYVFSELAAPPPAR